MTDRAVATECGLKVAHINEFLTNKFYAESCLTDRSQRLGR